MPNGPVLELVDLPGMHPPVGTALLHAYAPPAVIRLSIDPTLQPPGTIDREVQVDWVALPGNAPAVQVVRRVGWTNLQGAVPNLEDLLVQLPITVNGQDLTEQAAIAVMALLIRDLEGGVLQTVLPIGSGGDYFIQLQGRAPLTQVEISGIRQAANAGVSRARLTEKAAQVLTHGNSGYASVTTFAYPVGGSAGPIVHSYLHYVQRTPKKKGGRKGKGPPKPRGGRKGKKR